MKKTGILLCCILIFSMLLAPMSYAAGGNYDTLADWDIRIAVPDGKTAVLKGSEYYIYGQREGYIPYVMLTTYRYDSEEVFIDDFTAYMQKQYPDLQVTADAVQKTIGDKSCYEIDYGYKISGYDVRDRRIVMTVADRTYLFASKEVESQGMTLGSMLEEVVANCEFLSVSASVPVPAATPEPQQGSGPADAYLYCRENGMPKYWLDFTGAMIDSPVLHCYFMSGDPTYYESCFVLDLSTAGYEDGTIRFVDVYDQYGYSCGEWFKSLTLKLYNDAAVLTVERDERTLAGGAEDNILTGTYVMVPVGAGLRHASNGGSGLETYLRPAGDGPFTTEELGMWARIYYFRNYGFYPPEADVVQNPDGSYSIHLYEIVRLGESTHTATSAWYTVDAFGSGQDDIMGQTIDLLR